jgi:hypothetical protein
MSAKIPVEGERTQPGDAFGAESSSGKDQCPGTADVEMGVQEGDVEKNTSLSRDTQNAESNSTENEKGPVEPISGTALTILSLSFTIANFMIALDGSILGAWTAEKYPCFGH